MNLLPVGRCAVAGVARLHVRDLTNRKKMTRFIQITKAGNFGEKLLAPEDALTTATLRRTSPSFTADLTRSSLLLRVTHALIGIGTARFAWIGWARFQDDNRLDRTVQVRTTFVLTATAGVHMFLAIFQAPSLLNAYCRLPELAIQDLLDIVLNPLLVSCVGFLSGLRASAMLVLMVCSSSFAVIGLVTSLSSAAVAPIIVSCGLSIPSITTMISLFAGSSAILVVITYAHLDGFYGKALQITDTNGARVFMIGSVLIVGWWLFLVLHFLYLVGAISPRVLLQMIQFTDVITKVGAANLLTKSRYVIEAVALHFEDVARRMQSLQGNFDNIDEPAAEPPSNSEARETSPTF